MVTKVATVPVEAVVGVENDGPGLPKREEKEPLFKPPVVRSVVKRNEEPKPAETAVDEEVKSEKAPPEETNLKPAALPKVEVKQLTGPAPTPAEPEKPKTEPTVSQPAQPPADEAPPPPPPKPAQPAPAVQPAEMELPPPPKPQLPEPAPREPAPREELPPADPLAAPSGMPAPIPQELPLASVSMGIAPRTGRLPLDRAPEWVERKAAESYLFAQVGVVYYWDAPNFCYQPLYFEQPNVERLGYSRCAALQPAISGIHFFAQTLALPYQMTVHPYRRDCIYPLGHYRPGNPAPYRLIYPEWDAKAAAVQAAATTGLIFVLP
jgi:hypothetical protein